VPIKQHVDIMNGGLPHPKTMCIRHLSSKSVFTSALFIFQGDVVDTTHGGMEV
jgi:hypothetical protein